MQKRSWGHQLIVLGVVVFIAGIVVTMMMPKVYSSTAAIRVMFPESAGTTYDEDALKGLTRTHAVLVTSKPVLYEVIRNLLLQEYWGKQLTEKGTPLSVDLTYQLLTDSTKTIIPEDTIGLIQIQVFREDPQESARIANEIAHCYIDLSKDQSHQVSDVTATIVDPAEPSLKPASPNLRSNALLALCIAAIPIVIGNLLLNSKPAKSETTK